MPKFKFKDIFCRGSGKSVSSSRGPSVSSPSDVGNSGQQPRGFVSSPVQPSSPSPYPGSHGNVTSGNDLSQVEWNNFENTLGTV